MIGPALMGLLAGRWVSASGQCVSTRGVKPAPRGKLSGRPLLARSSDVAQQAGLKHPIVYGGVDKKSYILEVVGCGVAFIDYDNDGWPDLFVLSGTRLSDVPPGTSNPLYKNNRDGTFTGCTSMDYNRDGIGCKEKLTRSSGQTQFYEVQTAAGYLSASDRRLLMGLETDTVAAKLEIRWPGGRLQTLSNIKAGQQLIVKEPSE